MPLTDTQIKAFKKQEKTYRKADGGGLYIEVTAKGSKYWRLKYRINGKEKRIGFGVYPDVSLLEAREEREKAKKLIKQGIDPSFARKEAKMLAHVRTENTFEAIAREWHATQMDSWSKSHTDTVLHRLESDVFKMIGDRPIIEIEPWELIEVVKKIEARGALDVAKRTNQICGQVFKYAIPSGRAKRNPAADITGILKPYKKKHFPALELKDLPAFIQKLERNDARLYAQTIRATKLLMLTFVRTSELIQAKWDEFHWDDNEWHIPAQRMKMDKDHIVPLSKQTIALFEQQKELTERWEWVFPNQVRPAKPMSNNTILKAIERLGYKGQMSGHGFRAVARTAIREKLNYEPDIIEKQLAHKTSNPLGEAYDRTQFIDQRHTMMQEWADYLGELR